jgi:hypothetical protein
LVSTGVFRMLPRGLCQRRRQAGKKESRSRQRRTACESVGRLFDALTGLCEECRPKARRK